jgi:hypothetical protein
MEIKEIIPNLNKTVLYKGYEYKLAGSIIRKDKQGNIFYQAEILDKNSNSVCITRLEDIKCLDL